MTLTDLCDIKQHGDPKWTPPQESLSFDYPSDGTIIPVLGEVDLLCKVNERQQTINFKVIPRKQKLLLSCHTCLELGLNSINNVHAVDTEVSENNLLVEYKDVFEGLGYLQGDYHI